jgi:hypothetical protein
MSGIFDQIINYSPPLIVSGTVNYKGTWDASTNNPTLNNPPATSTKGDYYVVSTAGTQFTISFAVGDWIISSGTAWEKVDLTDAVSSVFGRTGAVVGVSTDYSAVGLTNTAIGASSPSTGAFTTVSASTPIAVASGGTGVSTSTGTTNVVLSNSPTIVTPVIATINDANGNETLKLASIASAVNEISIENAATGNPVHIRATGGDASVGLHLVAKGASGYVNVTDGVDETKRIMFNAAGGTTNTRTMLSSTQTVDRTLTLPDATGTLLYGGGPLGTPSSGTVTNLTGTASININGTVGATTASTGAFTTLSATGVTTVGNGAASTNGLLVLDGATTNNFGAVIRFNRGGTQQWQLGHESGINGGANNAFILYDQVGGAIGLKYTTSTGLAVTGALSATGALSITATAASSISRTLSVGALIASGNLSGLGFVPNSTGLSAGYNYSGGDAETNVIFGASSSSQQMRFQRWDGTTLTNVLTLVGTGNVGIGTTSPAGKIDCVTGSTGQPIYFRREDNGNQNIQIYHDAGGGYVAMGGTVAKELTIKNLNAAAINVIAGSNGVYLANAATSWASLSDERTKDIIENITDAATKVSSLRAVIGKYKTDSEGTRRSFLIAQDVQAVLPEAVDATNPDKLGLQYSDVIPLLVASIKELTQRVAALESN